MTSADQGEWPDAALLEKLVAYLDDPEDQGAVWRGLHFMEANGLDFALRSEELDGYLSDDQHSPIEDSRQLPFERKRQIILALRDRVRQDLGLPPLSSEEKRVWTYDRPEVLRYPGQLKGEGASDRYRRSAAERDEMRSFIAREQPEFLRAMKLFAEDGVRLGDRYDEINSTIWMHPRLRKLITRSRPELPAMDVHEFSLDLLEDAWRQAGGTRVVYSRLGEDEER